MKRQDNLQGYETPEAEGSPYVPWKHLIYAFLIVLAFGLIITVFNIHLSCNEALLPFSYP